MWSKMRRWEMVAWDGWPHALWKAWRRWVSPLNGYGIRYTHGMFRQVIKDGWQREYPENWLANGNPWEVTRPDATHQVGFGGTVETRTDEDGNLQYIWHTADTVDAVAYDTPIVGWRGNFANT